MKGNNFSLLTGLWLCTLSTFAAAPPLSIQQLPNSQLQITWPGTVAGFGLEQADSLSSPVAWQSVSATVVNNGGIFSVTIPVATQTRFYRLRGGLLTTILETSPADGEGGVAVTRETIFRLSAPLASGATVTTSQVFAEYGGRRLLSRAELSSDRQTITLFYLENLPASAQVRVSLMGNGLRDDGGQEVDADGDNRAGGTRVLLFITASTTALPNTAVTGRVFASELGATGTNRPLSGVVVTVDGAEETLRTTTDATGFFRLQPSPSGRFFVHVDGRTAIGSQWPNGAYYPFVGKAWDAVAGKTNNLAGGSGEIFLPLIQADALKTVSATNTTVITFAASVLATNPSLAGVTVSVPPNTLFSENGARGGKVGIAPVPPDRLPEPLPPGLNLPLVITIQTDGPQNFDRPVPVRFPNLPDPKTGVKLPPGAKTVLWSFNHDTGRWEPQGTCTISADGNFAETDLGVGVRQPGWHGVAPGSPVVAGPPRPPLPSECQGDDCPPCVQTIFCNVPTKPGKHYALCALDCLGNVMDDLFGDGKKPDRTAFETGLRCIGGPDKCPQNPDDALSKERRDCMDKCRFPDSEKRVYVVPCEGFTSPCPAPSLQSLTAGQAGPHSFAGLLPDRFEEQLRFWEVEGNFLIRLTGTAKILDNTQADVPKVTAFFNAFSDRVRASTPSGIHLSATERAELLALPRPAQFSLAEWTAMIDRLDSLQGNPIPTDVAAADQQLTDLVTELKRRGWKYRLDGVIHGFLRLSRTRAPAFGSEAFPVRAHYFYLKHHQSGLEQRGHLSSSGQFENMVLSPGGFYTVFYFDPVTQRSGAAFFQAANVGSRTVIPTAPLEALPPGELDTDGDLLPDSMERIVGTNASVADTDGDGLSDGNEIVSGTNPLDGTPVTLGTIAASDTPGTAIDVFAWNGLAAVADSAAGVAFFDVTNPLAPVLAAQLDTPGLAIGVAGSGALLAVADDAEGVALVDVSVPSAPVLIRQVKFNRPVRAVAITGGQIVAGLSFGELVLLAGSGEELQRTAADSVAVQDLLVLGGVVYVLKVGSIETFQVTGGALVSAGKVSSPGNAGTGGRRLRLSGGGNRLLATHAQGYNVFDLSLPLAPALLLQRSTTQFGWKQIIPDGSGRALAAVDANSTDDSAHDVSLYTIGTNSLGTNFVATFPTPGLAASLCFFRGVALVADSLSGLTVVNYVAREVGTNPPSVALRGRFGKSSTAAESGAWFTLIADATDNHLVREVEFYINDKLAAVDGNYPFEVNLRTPPLPPTQTTFTARARAFDTAGNSAWSDLLTIDLSKDLTEPTLIGFRPGARERFHIGDVVIVSARFDEPMAAAAVSTGFSLFNTGGDGTPGTGDDLPIPSTVTETGPAEYTLSFTQPLPLGDYAARVTTNVKDLAGNPLPSAFTWQFRVPPFVEFTGAASLLWNATSATSNNWSSLHIPTTNDFVRIAASGGATVNVSQQVSAFDLNVTTPLNFESGTTLRIDRQAVFDGPITLRDGSWQGGEVTLRGETQISSFPSLVDQNWNNQGHVILGPDASLNFRNTAGTRTTLRNFPGATWEIVNSQMGVLNLSSGPADFENQGLVIARGTNRNYIGTSRFINTGAVEVREGILDIRAGGVNEGASQHLGSYRVDADATLRFLGLSQFGPASRIFGGGNVNINNTVFPGSYEIDGETTISGNLTFSGPVRSRGIWKTRGGHAIFTGLNPEITGVVESEGALTVSVLPLMHLNDLRVYRDCTITTALEVNGPLLLDSTVTPSGSIAAARLLGTGRLRANGPLSFAGIVNSAGQGLLEIGSTAACRPGTIIQLGTGYAIKVLPSGSFDVSGASSLKPRGTLTNEGTLFKTDTNTTQLTSTLQNSGTVRLAGGTFEILNGKFAQTAGVLSLAGGNLNAHPAPGFSADTATVLQGGRLEGAGIFTCGSFTNSAEITPGLPLGILNLQIGTHPTLSVYQQTATGKLSIDVGGATPGTEHDQLQVSGRALLNGTLELKPAPSFNPPLGQEFTILASAKVEGTFAAVTGTALPGGKRFNVVYEAAAVKLRVVTGP